MTDWKYYNHAVIPAVEPHEEPDLSCIKDGSIWKMGGAKPLLARWTTDWDCGYETSWWYCIKEAPYSIDELSRSTRKHIRQALKKVYVEIINPVQYAKDIYRVYEEAVKGYKNFIDTTTEETFIESLINDKKIYWGAFDAETKVLVAYMAVVENRTFVNTSTAKFSKNHMNLNASTAMYHEILEYYINKRGFLYVNGGERNINHETNTQEYKIKTFHYKKAYCHLHVAYNPKIGWAVKLMYPFRKILKTLDRLRIIHLINGVLKMEEICRIDVSTK